MTTEAPPNSGSQTLAAAIRSAMDAKGLSMRGLAKESRVGLATISEICSGHTLEPSRASLTAIAEALGLPLRAVGLEESIAATAPLPVAPAFAPTERRSAPPIGAAAVEGGEIHVPHDRIRPSPLNPRKRIDDAAVAELAESIARVGLLQNLTVRTLDGGESYEIVAGERRWRALAALVADGRWPASKPVPVRVRDLDDMAVLELAFSENVQRKDMHPLEEAEALRTLVDQSRAGDKAAETLAARLGLTARWVRGRVALARKLAPQAKDLFSAGTINLEQAKALMLGTPELQAQVATEIAANPERATGTEYLRRQMIGQLPPLKWAIFKRKDYTGEITGDEDSPDEDRRFADVAQFRALQTKAIEEKRAKFALEWAWCDVHHGYASTWNYGRSDNKATAGVLIEVRDSLEVTIHTGLLRAVASEGASASAAGKGKPQAEAFTKAHLAAAHRLKSQALQARIAKDPTMAMRLVCLGLLGGTTAVHIEAAEHGNDDREAMAPEVLAPLEVLARFLGIEATKDNRRGPVRFSPYDRGNAEAKIWDKLCRLGPGEVPDVFAALVALRCGTFSGYTPALGDDPVAIAVAKTLSVTCADGDVISNDHLWLDQYRKPALVELAIASGAFPADQMPRLLKMKAADLRQAIRTSETRDGTFCPRELRFGTTDQLEALALKVETPE